MDVHLPRRIWPGVPAPFLREAGQASFFVIALILACFVVLALNSPKLSAQHLFLFFLGVLVFILAFNRTHFALGVLIFSMLLSPEFSMGQVAARAVVVRADDILLFIIFVGWLAKLAVFKELGILKKTVLNMPIFLYILVCVLATAVTLIEGHGSPRRSFFFLLKYIEYFMVYFLAVNNIENMRQVKVYTGLLIATCVLVSVYALAAYYLQGGRATAPFEGTEGEANTLSGYLVFLMGLMLGLLMHSGQRRTKVALLGCLVLASATLLLTLSRSGWLSFFAMYVGLLAFSRRFKPLLGLGLVLILILTPLLAPRVVRERWTSTFASGKTYRVGGKSITVDESGSARIDVWQRGFEKLLEKPFLGHGIPGAEVIDNQYTLVMLETGLLGLGIFGFLIFRVFSAGRYAFQQTQGEPWAQGIALGFLAGFCGLLMHAFSAATFIIIRIMEPFWFLAGIVVLLPGMMAPRPDGDLETT